MPKALHNENFWEQSDYSKKEYQGSSITQEMIDEVENKTGYLLPKSYIKLLESQNGGIPNNRCFPSSQPTSWSEDHIQITGILGLDKSKSYSLLGSLGSEFMKSEWGYPDIGLYICDCPSAGHDMVALDYSKCGRKGNPKVVHVDQELNYKVTILADSFEDFILGLVDENSFQIDISSEIEPQWIADRISYSIIETGSLFSTRPELVLTQELKGGESGWNMTNYLLPKKMKRAKIKIIDNKVRLSIKKDVYFIDENNFGKLSFEILNAGDITDIELTRIWDKIAK